MGSCMEAIEQLQAVRAVRVCGQANCSSNPSHDKPEVGHSIRIVARQKLDAANAA